jgi:hypothetical protein
LRSTSSISPIPIAPKDPLVREKAHGSQECAHRGYLDFVGPNIGLPISATLPCLWKSRALVKFLQICQNLFVSWHTPWRWRSFEVHFGLRRQI